MNTYTHGMFRDFDEAIIRARFDDKVTAIVITGAGEKFFSAGASIKMLNSVSPGFKYNFCLHANETLSRLEQTPKIVIAAINGHAVGGGLEIAMAADIRIARKNSGKVGLPEINLGVLAGTGGTARLTRLIGKAKALEMMVTGELMSFEDAKNHTLINQIWEGNATEFREMMLDWVSAQFTLPNKAAKAVGNIKRSCQTGPEIPSSTTLRSSVNSRPPLLQRRRQGRHRGLRREAHSFLHRSVKEEGRNDLPPPRQGVACTSRGTNTGHCARFAQKHPTER